jgi:hypothetical protein
MVASDVMCFAAPIIKISKTEDDGRKILPTNFFVSTKTKRNFAFSWCFLESGDCWSMGAQTGGVLRANFRRFQAISEDFSAIFELVENLSLRG